MRHSAFPDHAAGDAVPAKQWSARGRQFGVGVLIAFTIKGICTSAMILTALFAATGDSDADLFPHLLVWTVACIGGFCMLGGWRRVRVGDGPARREERLPKRID